MDAKGLKARLIAEIDDKRPQLTELALKIHANPELGFHEVKASGWLAEFLEENGFKVERNFCKLETAFKASYGKGRPAIAILAEYDALPVIGHACGHNLIATIAAGAGIASKAVIDKYGGAILVIGTPAEELYGGKAIMAARGAFENLDAAMMAHPENYDGAITRALACQTLNIEFFGKAAHAAAQPEIGINALEAMLLSFAGINALRQHIRSTARIHGIITDGGEAANIVPAHSAGEFLVRSEDNLYLEELKQKVLNCFFAAATATGARLEYKWDEVCYAPMLNNLTLAKLYAENMGTLGRKVLMVSPSGFGSTDMGNVSQIIPGIHPYIGITRATSIHSAKFAEAAASETGIKGMLDAAKALSMTVADLMASTETLTKVKEEFEQVK